MYDGCTVEEIIAYRELEKEVFDFGEGPMKMKESGIYEKDIFGFQKNPVEKSYENEDEHDCYYSLLKNSIGEDFKEEFSERKNKINRYKRKTKDKEKIEKLRKNGICYAVSNHKPYLRIYKGKRSRFLKREANRKVRNYINNIADGSSYKKVYELEYNLY